MYLLIRLADDGVNPSVSSLTSCHVLHPDIKSIITLQLQQCFHSDSGSVPLVFILMFIILHTSFSHAVCLFQGPQFFIGSLPPPISSSYLLLELIVSSYQKTVKVQYCRKHSKASPCASAERRSPTMLCTKENLNRNIVWHLEPTEEAVGSLV